MRGPVLEIIVGRGGAEFRFGDYGVPVAELVVVAVVFWTVVCGNAATDVLGNVCVGGTSWGDALLLLQATEGVSDRPTLSGNVLQEGESQGFVRELIKEHGNGPVDASAQPPTMAYGSPAIRTEG